LAGSCGPLRHPAAAPSRARDVCDKNCLRDLDISPPIAIVVGPNRKHGPGRLIGTNDNPGHWNRFIRQDGLLL
jgi:hypothetical protein